MRKKKIVISSILNANNMIYTITVRNKEKDTEVSRDYHLESITYDKALTILEEMMAVTNKEFNNEF